MLRVNQSDFNAMITACDGDPRAICQKLNEDLQESYMKVRVPCNTPIDTTKVVDEVVLDVKTSQGDVRFEINYSQVQDRGFSGLSVAQVDVKGRDGLKARFFVTVQEDDQGRPSVAVTAKQGGKGADKRVIAKGRYYIEK